MGDVINLVHGVTHQRDWLLVSETFYTLQGEGPSTGTPAYFIRLGTCNQHCRWCDTNYTWAFTSRQAAEHESGKQFNSAAELRRETLPQLANKIHRSRAPLAVISGGEPLIQRDTVSALISLCNESVYAPEFEIETAGTISPGDLSLYHNVAFNVSPKLESSGNPRDVRYRPEVLREFAQHPRSTFKFVIDTRQESSTAGCAADLAEMMDIVKECDIPHHTIWLMPCATNERELQHGLQVLSAIALDQRWHLTGRQQVTIWGSERGH